MGEVKKLLSVVVPCYNEEDVLMSFYDTTLTVLDGMSTELDYEFIFVDDGSKDRTLSIMRELAGIDDNVRYVSFAVVVIDRLIIGIYLIGKCLKTLFFAHLGIGKIDQGEDAAVESHYTLGAGKVKIPKAVLQYEIKAIYRIF